MSHQRLAHRWARVHISDMTLQQTVLTNRAVVKVGGPDWRAFLNGLLTQSTLKPSPSGLTFAALLTPQGRLVNDILIWEAEEAALLDVSADAAAAFAARLTTYRLRARVEIAPIDAVVEVRLGAAAAPGDGWRADPRLPELGARRVKLSKDQADPAVEAAYETMRRRAGVPDGRLDAIETDYPIELNFDLLHGIDFHKGCFVGQETTSRMHRRNGVKSRILPLVFDGPAPPFGSEVLAGDLRAGDLRGGQDGGALALLRLDRGLEAALTVAGRPARAAPPAWMSPHLSTTAPP